MHLVLATAGTITDRIIREIQGSEFLFADLTGSDRVCTTKLGTLMPLANGLCYSGREVARFILISLIIPVPSTRTFADLERQLAERLSAQGFVKR